MRKERWTWDPAQQPELVALLEAPENREDWCDVLEDTQGYMTGNILAVCAALSIARAAREYPERVPPELDDQAALELLERWIDTSKESEFEAIRRMLFARDGKEGSVAALSFAVWWALRCATSHPDGCGEIAWALGSLRAGMVERGFSAQWLREAGLRGVRSRCDERLPG